jgi:hypothetical protein
MPFKPGQSGNPNGRPKKAREERFLEITLSAVSFADWKEIIQKAVVQAKRGDSTARKWLSDYLIGHPIQKHELEGNLDKPVVFKVIYDRGKN